ncbi:MAG: hypothetical protein K2O12_06820, partial [Muribaculaceae bacterium]|nr:hypothetical protein [Muribaculaceae bacterium]
MIELVMKHIYIILIALLSVLFSVPAAVAAASDKSGHESEPLDTKEILFEHLGDAYGWEVPFNHHKRIPLPVIVYGSDGFHVFSS